MYVPTIWKKQGDKDMNSNQQKHTNRVLSTVISLAILTVLLFSTAVGFAEEEQKKTIKAATNGKPAPYVTISDKGEIMPCSRKSA